MSSLRAVEVVPVVEESNKPYFTVNDLARAYPLMIAQVEPWTQILLSEAARGAIHVSNKLGLQMCRSLGRQHKVFEKNYMGAFSKVTCGHCKRYVKSGSRTVFVVPEGDSDD